MRARIGCVVRARKWSVMLAIESRALSNSFLFFPARAVALIVGGPTHAHRTTPVVRLPRPSDPALASRAGRPRRIRMTRDGIPVPGVCDTRLDLFR
jgi:hypothetical protein